MANTLALAKLLQAQHGVVSARQAAAIGLHSTGLHRLVTRHGWKRPLPGVYLHPEASGFDAEAMALCLWGGDGCILSHAAAARLLGLAGMEKASPEVTVPDGRAHPAARVHRGAVPPEDRRIRAGIPYTSAARTLIDLASVVPEAALAIAFEDAWKKQLIQLDWVERRLCELGARGRRGARALGRLLKDAWRRGKPMDSPLEVKFWRFARLFLRPHLPEPGFEVWGDEGAPMVIDFAYPRERVAIEVHSFLIHGQLPAHERDALRASRLGAIGWRIQFVTNGQLQEPEKLARRLRSALAFDTSSRPGRIVYDAFEGPAVG